MRVDTTVTLIGAARNKIVHAHSMIEPGRLASITDEQARNSVIAARDGLEAALELLRLLTTKLPDREETRDE